MALCVGVLPTVGFLVSTAPGAVASGCPDVPSLSLKDAPYTEVGDFATAARIRSGPSTSCPVVGTGYPDHYAVFACYRRTGYQETWTYLTDRSTGITGWTRDDLLTGNGSGHVCPA